MTKAEQKEKEETLLFGVCLKHHNFDADEAFSDFSLIQQLLELQRNKTLLDMTFTKGAKGNRTRAMNYKEMLLACIDNHISNN